MSTSVAPPRLRADAAQNRALLLQAAEEVFTELGVQAPLEAVSTRAGLGRATLFRNFPDRQALVMALLERGLDKIDAEAQSLRGASDELLQLLRFVLERMTFRAPLVEYWQTADRQRPEIQAGIARIVAIFQPVIARAVATGQCRADLAPNDLLLLLALFGGALCAGSEAEREAFAARIWTFALDIVQPPAPRRARKS
jgi:AcrR family transcriptional regulator